MRFCLSVTQMNESVPSSQWNKTESWETMVLLWSRQQQNFPGVIWELKSKCFPRRTNVTALLGEQHTVISVCSFLNRTVLCFSVSSGELKVYFLQQSISKIISLLYFVLFKNIKSRPVGLQLSISRLTFCFLVSFQFCSSVEQLWCIWSYFCTVCIAVRRAGPLWYGYRISLHSPWFSTLHMPMEP